MSDKKKDEKQYVNAAISLPSTSTQAKFIAARMASQRRANRAGGPRASQQTGEEQLLWDGALGSMEEVYKNEARMKEIQLLVVPMEARLKATSGKYILILRLLPYLTFQIHQLKRSTNWETFGESPTV